MGRRLFSPRTVQPISSGVVGAASSGIKPRASEMKRHAVDVSDERVSKRAKVIVIDDSSDEDEDTENDVEGIPNRDIASSSSFRPNLTLIIPPLPSVELVRLNSKGSVVSLTDDAVECFASHGGEPVVFLEGDPAVHFKCLGCKSTGPSIKDYEWSKCLKCKANYCPSCNGRWINFQ